MRVLPCFILLLLSAQVYAQASSGDTLAVSDALVGTWDLKQIPQGIKPCSEASISYLQDGTVTARSGEQIVEGHYSAKSYRSGYLVTQEMTGHNGKPNCQGYSGDFVMQNNVPQVYIEVEADSMRMYFDSASTGNYALLIRRKERDRDRQDN